MTRIQVALMSGGFGLMAAFPTVIVGSYIKCFFNNIEYQWPIVLMMAAKSSAFAGVVLGILEYVAGGIPPNKGFKR